MGKKALIPEEKWEGLRKAMEEAAGTRKTSKTPGFPPEAEGEAVRPEREKKRGGAEAVEKERKKQKKEKKNKKGKKEKEKEKKKKKGKKGKGKKRKKGKG
jgi:hypothetical protein